MKVFQLFKNYKKNAGNENFISSQNTNLKIEGIELPKNWENLNSLELKEQARKAILELSRNTNSEKKAKELGFKNANHLMELCYDFILK